MEGINIYTTILGIGGLIIILGCIFQNIRIRYFILLVIVYYLYLEYVFYRLEGVHKLISIIMPLFLFTAIPDTSHKSAEDKSSFKEAVYCLLKEEGGLANNRSDKGGITNYGISIKFLKGLVKDNKSLINELDLNRDKNITPCDVKNMTRAEAEYIYKTQWWDKYNYGKINYQPLANKIFELAVNIGPYPASLILVKASRRKIVKCTSKLDMDIVNYVNSLSENEKKELMKKLTMLSIQYYFGIVDKNPSQARFLKGWLRRAKN